jgi:hypothetical protein
VSPSSRVLLSLTYANNAVKLSLRLVLPPAISGRRLVVNPSSSSLSSSSSSKVVLEDFGFLFESSVSSLTRCLNCFTLSSLSRCLLSLAGVPFLVYILANDFRFSLSCFRATDMSRSACPTFFLASVSFNYI